MKKAYILALLVLALVTLSIQPAFAAAATVTSTEYGYEITGGTDATVINAHTIWVRGMAFSAASANDTAVLTSGASNVSCFKFKSITATDPANNFFASPMDNTPFTNLTVTLSGANDILYIYLA